VAARFASNTRNAGAGKLDATAHGLAPVFFLFGNSHFFTGILQ
jgi:hypothetical protein